MCHRWVGVLLINFSSFSWRLIYYSFHLSFFSLYLCMLLVYGSFDLQFSKEFIPRILSNGQDFSSSWIYRQSSYHHPGFVSFLNSLPLFVKDKQIFFFCWISFLFSGLCVFRFLMNGFILSWRWRYFFFSLFNFLVMVGRCLIAG